VLRIGLTPREPGVASSSVPTGFLWWHVSGKMDGTGSNPKVTTCAPVTPNGVFVRGHYQPIPTARSETTGTAKFPLTGPSRDAPGVSITAPRLSRTKCWQRNGPHAAGPLRYR
jgi:hypothetical protein